MPETLELESGSNLRGLRSKARFMCQQAFGRNWRFPFTIRLMDSDDNFIWHCVMRGPKEAIQVEPRDPDELLPRPCAGPLTLELEGAEGNLIVAPITHEEYTAIYEGTDLH